MTTQIVGGGTTTLDALSVSGATTFGQQPTVPAQSMVMVNTHAAYGTLPTRCRTFSNFTNGVNGCVIQGTDITFAHDTVNGDTFTANTNGVYSITTCFSSAADTNQGISKNTTTLNSDVSAIAVNERLASARPGNTSGAVQCVAVSWTGYLAAGSVIRAHGDNTSASVNTLANFTITRVS